MSVATVRTGVDTFAWSGSPASEYPNAARLRLDSGAAYAYFRFGIPAPMGSTILSAKLRVTQISDWAGSRTLTAQRIADPWKVARTNWNNRPGVGGTPVNVTQADTKHGDWWEFDVTADVQAFVDGGVKNRGWRIATDDTTLRYIRGLNHSTGKPVLEVEWSDAPDAPTTLSPSSGAVSVQFPVLGFDYTDVSGSTSLNAVRVQIDATADATDDPLTADFDSGEIVTTEPQLDTATTTWAGLADGAATQWRVKVRDAAGLWSEWSDWAALSRDTKGTVTIDSPGAEPNNYVTEATPPIVWTFTGEIQTAWQVFVARSSAPASPIYNSGVRTGEATSHALPADVITDADEPYIVTVRVWDDKDREDTPGDNIYAVGKRTFTYQEDAAVTPVDWVSATQADDQPWVQLTWSRATAPDTFTVWRDGKIIDADAEPAETHVSGSVYSLNDYTAMPNRQHTYRVAAVVNGVTGDRGPEHIYEPVTDGVWLVDPATGRHFSLADTTWQLANGEKAIVHEPIGAKAVVRIVSGMTGLAGSVSGILTDYAERTYLEQEADLLNMKETPAEVYRLVMPGLNIPVVAGEITAVPNPDAFNDEMSMLVTFSVWQVGGLRFKAQL